MDANETRLCNCGHDLDLHGPLGCTAGNRNGRKCWCSRLPNGVLALFETPKPSPVSLQSMREPEVDAILSKFWAVQEHHQVEHEEQMRILRERRAHSGKKFS
jgi:hypothetical protein